MSKPEPVNCYRCGKPGYTGWVDVRGVCDPEPVLIAGRQYCLTDGCTDLDGSRRLVALTPAEMRHTAERFWMNRQRRLTEER